MEDSPGRYLRLGRAPFANDLLQSALTPPGSPRGRPTYPSLMDLGELNLVCSRLAPDPPNTSDNTPSPQPRIAAPRRSLRHDSLSVRQAEPIAESGGSDRVLG